MNFQPNLKKKGGGGGLIEPKLLEEGCWERRGSLFPGVGGYNFHIKNKLKPEIFNDIKSSKAKIFLVTFKRSDGVMDKKL